MGIRAQLEKKIEAKKQEIVQLETNLREANAVLSTLQDVLKMLPKEGTDDRKTEQALRPGTEVARAYDFIKAKGKPQYIEDILKGIGKEVTKENRASLGGSLGNYARKGEIFKKTAPNTFGLIEPDSSEPESASDEKGGDKN